MSRIIVKNLPKKITEQRIREVFGTKGLITDVQLKYTSEGKFRQFCFVGFYSEDEATKAITYFNNSRIDTSKIIVEQCTSLGAKEKPKSWSKYSSDSSAFKQKNPSKPDEINTVEDTVEAAGDNSTNLLEKYKDDPLFEEFLEVHDKSDAEKLKLIKFKKVTEEADDLKLEESGVVSDTGQTVDTENKEISDLDYLKKLKSQPKKAKEPKQLQLFTLKLRGLPYSCKKKEIKHFFKPIVPFSIRLPRNVKGIAYVAFKQEKLLTKALLKDKSFISGKQICVMKYNQQSDAPSEIAVDPKRVKWKNQEESIKNEEDIAESGMMFIRNLSYSTTEDDVQKLFETFGPITEVNLPIDTNSRKAKGFGTVTFLMPEHAVKAYSQLDGRVLHGRMLHLLPAKVQANPNETQDDNNTGDFKARKAAKQKASAGSTHNWNALFLGADAVAGVAADRFGTTKGAVVLDGEDAGENSAAVRLALAETQIVAETRRYLIEQGVMLSAFAETGTPRSKTIILVKNLPANTEAKELKKIFSPHGMIGRIIMPPGGISAIIEYLEPSEARNAFTNLAYSKFKNLPLYLEWAPQNTLDDTKPPPSNLEDSHSQGNMDKEREVKEQTKQEPEEPEDEDPEEPEPDTTLFVKNLSFSTTDGSLKEHFSSCGKISYATVATKKDGKNPNSSLSMGYGFVQFMYKAGADKALKTLQQSVLDGKSLELKRSERTLQNEVTSAAKPRKKKTKQTGTKILIRNIPFQANKHEVQELFKVFGEIKALRLPKKMMAGPDSHRGFGFVDYITNSDAKKAFEALSESTHLYGRRLVLEWAAADPEVGDIRKRTAEHFHEADEAKKSKKSVFNFD